MNKSDVRKAVDLSREIDKLGNYLSNLKDPKCKINFIETHFIKGSTGFTIEMRAKWGFEEVRKILITLFELELSNAQNELERL